jgi:xanthine dehydrogenase accessory factor
MLVFADGSQEGTVGGGAMEVRVVEEALAVLSDGRTRLVEYSLIDPDRGDPGVCGGDVNIYLEPYMPPHTVLVVGCGHVGRAVVDLAHWLGYRTIAVDDRDEVLTPDVLPHADVRVSGVVADVIDDLDVTEETSIIMVSRSVDLDVDALPHLVATPARYLGVMGSARRWQVARKRLLEGGLREEDLATVRTPIGIELHAETLEEIAVSILAEVISVNRAGAHEDDGG